MISNAVWQRVRGESGYSRMHWKESCDRRAKLQLAQSIFFKKKGHVSRRITKEWWFLWRSDVTKKRHKQIGNIRARMDKKKLQGGGNNFSYIIKNTLSRLSLSSATINIPVNISRTDIYKLNQPPWIVWWSLSLGILEWCSIVFMQCTIYMSVVCGSAIHSAPALKWTLLVYFSVK